MVMLMSVAPFPAFFDVLYVWWLDGGTLKQVAPAALCSRLNKAGSAD